MVVTYEREADLTILFINSCAINPWLFSILKQAIQLLNALTHKKCIANQYHT